MSGTVLEGFAGPGGLSEAARMVGLDQTIGVELNHDACATAQAAGHTRMTADIRTLNPADFHDVEGWVSGPPCPTYSTGGNGTGLSDYQLVLDSVIQVSDTPDARPVLDGLATHVADPRTALVLEALEVALALPNLQWIVAEQVPAVRGIWEEIASELTAMHGWTAADVITLRADDFGAPTRRARVFLIARRDNEPDLAGVPTREHWVCGKHGPGPRLLPPNLWTPFPPMSMAAALGWPAGIRINTRGNRQTPGGNEFTADGPAPALTGRARSWYRTDLGPLNGQLTPRQAGVLQGFPRDYPWQGSRTAQFQQIADSVPPLMGAAVIGAASGRPWRDAVQARLHTLYGIPQPSSSYARLCDTGRTTRIADQPDLFSAVA